MYCMNSQLKKELIKEEEKVRIDAAMSSRFNRITYPINAIKMEMIRPVIG